MAGIEIERKYIIMKPTEQALSLFEGYSRSEIEQIYLKSDGGTTHRIRRRTSPEGKAVFTETKKRRIDSLSSFEEERKITEEEYLTLKANRDTNTVPIIKTRHCFTYSGQLFEIDVYPLWKNTAIMETELKDREQAVAFPKEIKIIREVTGDRRYSNAGMSKSFPKEYIIL